MSNSDVFTERIPKSILSEVAGPTDFRSFRNRTLGKYEEKVREKHNLRDDTKLFCEFTEEYDVTSKEYILTYIFTWD